ncbi:XRE family transcriptional regulator [Anabaena minutissima FACHB-250]|nr:XRE family transcriptional regulator [Anabaena minutissima FACHB-250]
MISLLEKKVDQPQGTSACGSMVDKPHNYRIVSRVFLHTLSTATNTTQFDQNLFVASEMTSSGLTIPSTSSAETTRIALNQLRKLSGLTWDQLARLFDVSRRSLHSWASGKPLSRFNEEQLNRLLATVQYINCGSVSLNRSLLLTPSIDGRLPFDLLIAGQYEEVKRILGSGNAPQRPKLAPLSEDARTSRMPPNPADLVDALQEPIIHREVGRSRPARAVRSRRNGSGQ